MKVIQSLLLLAISALFSACQTFDEPIDPKPFIIKKDLTGVYEYIGPDQDLLKVKDTLRVYMPYEGIYSLEFEKVTKTDSTESSETNMIGLGHLSKLNKDLYFNQHLEGEWVYYHIRFDNNDIKARVVGLNNYKKHMDHATVLYELEHGKVELNDEMIFIKKK
ncbi:MAG: hypothetical protein HKN39_01510 [Flavobacteriales bacterium]|nr:hypothetical protein [Flavobacteriales bacterium]